MRWSGLSGVRDARGHVESGDDDGRARASAEGRGAARASRRARETGRSYYIYNLI